MSTSLRVALREALPAVSRQLASWKLSVVLMVLAALYYALLAIWAKASAPAFVHNIANLLPFWIVYALLLVNTFWCLAWRYGALRRELRAEIIWQGTRPTWELAVPDGGRVSAASLRAAGWNVRDEAAGVVRALRHRGASLGTFLFHGSFFLLALGFLTTIALREEHKIVVADGETYTGAEGQVLAREGSPLVTSGPPDERFTLTGVVPEFWRDQMLFTRLEATVVPEGGAPRTVRINDPVWFGPATLLRLTGIGFAPRYELLDSQGRVVETAFLKLNVFPPGQRDTFRLQAGPHRIQVEVYPDLVVTDGVPASRTLNLVKPGYFVRVARGRVELGEKVLEPNETFAFEGFRLRFPEIHYWAELKVLRDPGAILLLVSFLAALAGLVLKIRGKRAEIEWVPSGPGGAGVLRGWGGEAPSLADVAGVAP